MAPFTAAQAQATAERLTAEDQAIRTSLMKLEDHLRRKRRESAALNGEIHEHGAEVRYGVATLWTLYETYRAKVMRFQAIRARRSPPMQTDLEEMEELMTGATTVTLPNPDGSSQPRRRRFTLDELMAEFRSAYTEVCAVINAVDQVRAALSPRLQHCHELLSQAESRAAFLGVATGPDPMAPVPITAVLSELADQLSTVRQIGLIDPLRLWAEDTVDLSEIERITLRCEQVCAELAALDEVRRQAEARLGLVETMFAEVAWLRRQTSDEHHRAYAKICGVPAPDPAAPAVDLPDSRLATARELGRHASWQRLVTELAVLEHDAEAALQRARTELAAAGRPLRERAELRGRLGAYRAKAAALGRIEDLALDKLYQRARDLLWSAPCDLARAASSVVDYQHAVNGEQR